MPRILQRTKNQTPKSGNFVKQYPDQLCRLPLYTEPHNNEKEMSTQTRIIAHVDHKTAHFLKNPVANPTEPSSSRHSSLSEIWFCKELIFKAILSDLL